MKHQETTTPDQPVTAEASPPPDTGAPDSSTESRCGKLVTVNTDVDESEVWHCVKDAGHQDDHYVENDDGSCGMAIKLTPIEVAHWRGFAVGAASVGKSGSPDDLRAQGWSVAVHNDYKLHGEGEPSPPLSLDELERLDRDATSEPWEPCRANKAACQCALVWAPKDDAVVLTTAVYDASDVHYSREQNTRNQRFVVALRNAFPSLAKELRRTRQALASANALIGEAADEAKRLQDRIDQLEAELKDRP